MTNDFRADLHCHTTCSDGSCTVEQIVKLAKESGLSGLSITDHDSVEAYTTAIPLCEREGIILIPGVEFSATFEKHSVHTLGYGFDLNHSAITTLCARHQTRRETRNAAMLKKLTEHKKPLTIEELLAAVPDDISTTRHTVGRPHIALAMIRKGYVSSIPEAFNKYLGEGKCCYVQGTEISVAETIAAIHEAKGIACLAHPHLIKNDNLVKKLLKEKFDAIECFYGKFHSNVHHQWLKIAQKHNLLVTGGSDFHGDPKPMLSLGCSWISKEPFQALVDRIAELHHG
ncbi:MAG: PHP domain-containing protein [Parachlamydiaceae bacterium]